MLRVPTEVGTLNTGELWVGQPGIQRNLRGQTTGRYNPVPMRRIGVVG